MLPCCRALVTRRPPVSYHQNHLVARVSTRGISRNSAIAKGLRDSVKHAQTVRKRVDEYRQNQELARFTPGTEQRGETRDATPVKERDERENAEDHYPVAIPRTKADSEFICGRRSVLSALKAGKRQLYKLFLNVPKKLESKPDGYLAEILALAKDAGVGFSYDRQTTEAIARHEEVGNPLATAFVLEASPLRQDQVEYLGKCDVRNREFSVSYQGGWNNNNQEDARTEFSYEQSWQKQPRKPLILWLHGVSDTGNIGSIIRTAVYMGVDAILLSTRTTGAITVNSHITSTGATEFINLFRVPQPRDFMEQSRRNGWKFFASVRPETLPGSLNQVAFGEVFEERGGMSPLAEHPCVVMLGNETDGLPDWIAAKADERISIGGPSKLAERAGIDSFNVSVAAALLSERFLRQPAQYREHLSRNSHSAAKAPLGQSHALMSKHEDALARPVYQQKVRRRLQEANG